MLRRVAANVSASAVLILVVLFVLDGDDPNPVPMRGRRGLFRRWRRRLLRPDELKITRYNTYTVKRSGQKHAILGSPDYLHIVAVARGVSAPDSDGYKLRLKLRALLRSLILRTFDNPLHLIFLAGSEEDADALDAAMAAEYPSMILENDITGGKTVDR